MTLAAKLAHDEKAQAHAYTAIAPTNKDDTTTMLGKLRTRLTGIAAQTDRRAQTKDFLARHNMSPSGSIVAPVTGEQTPQNPCAPIPPSSAQAAASHSQSVQRLQLLETQLAAQREENVALRALQLSSAMPATDSSVRTRSKSDRHAYQAPKGRNLAPACPRLSDMWDSQHGVSPGAHGRIPARKAPPPRRQQGLLLETLEEFRARVQS